VGHCAAGFLADAVVYKELKIIGALGVDAPAYRAALKLLASGRYPFATLPRRCVGLDPPPTYSPRWAESATTCRRCSGC